jgi:hypothetical protein
MAGEGYPASRPSLAYGDVAYINGEAAPMAAGKAVYLSAAGTVKLAKNNGTEREATVIGFTAAAITNGASGPITTVHGKRIAGLAGLTPAAPVFLGTAGGVTSTAPGSGFLTQLGDADSAAALAFIPRQPFGL